MPRRCCSFPPMRNPSRSLQQAPPSMLIWQNLWTQPMWRELLNGPWPDRGDLSPLIQQQARTRIRRYWRRQIWLQIILGEAFLWFAAELEHVQHAHAYGVPLALVSIGYLLGILPNFDLLWM